MDELIYPLCSHQTPYRQINSLVVSSWPARPRWWPPLLSRRTNPPFASPRPSIRSTSASLARADEARKGATVQKKMKAQTEMAPKAHPSGGRGKAGKVSPPGAMGDVNKTPFWPAPPGWGCQRAFAPPPAPPPVPATLDWDTWLGPA